jgi:hypothetical protein
MTTRLEDIAKAVDEFSTAALTLSTLLQSWDPAHAKLIEGVLGIVQKTAKSYEQP